MRYLILKLILAFFLLPASQVKADAYEKLPADFLIQYGDKNAQIKVTYLFSIYCPSCLNFMKEDFPRLKEKYIDTGLVEWIWHPFPNPEKPLTYQAMLCLGELSENQKRIFLENAVNFLNEKNMHSAPDYFCHLMKLFGHPIEDIYSRDFLLKPKARQSAAHFMSQKRNLTIPSVEVNEEYYDRYPTSQFVEKQIEKALANLRSHNV